MTDTLGALLDVIDGAAVTGFVVFLRIAAAMAFLPGFGEATVPARVKLAVAVAFTAVVAPAVSPAIAPVSDNPAALFSCLWTETLIGLAIGTAARLLLSSLNVAGNVIAVQTGLGFALSVDPSQGQHGAIVATFLTTVGVLMIFTTGAHALLFSALVRSYDLFPVGAAPSTADFLELIVRFISGSFALGIELTVPFLVLSLVFYAGLGVVSKMMPQFQVFFISMPLSIMAGFAMLMVLIGTMLEIFLDRFGEAFGEFAR